MKKLSSILTTMFFSCVLCVAQTKWEKVIDIPFGSGENQLALRVEQQQQLKIALGSFPDPRDIQIGPDGSFYIPDDNNWRVLVYDKEGRPSDAIPVPHKDTPSTQFGYMMALAADPDGRLYVHVTYRDHRLLALYRFDKDRKQVFRFPFSDRKPGGGDLVGSIYAGSSGHVYIPSFPVEILRANWDNTVFKYDASGKFVGMVDYSIEDLDGRIYKALTQKSGNGYSWNLFQYSRSAEPSATSQKLERIGTLSIPAKVIDNGLNVENYILCGFDSGNNIYVTNGKVTKVFNQSLNLLREISTPVDELEEASGFIGQLQNIRVSPDGGVYIFGLKTPHGRQKSFYSPSDAIFVIMKFK